MNQIAQRPTLDLTVRRAIYRRGDITAYLTWRLDTGEPCIVLVPNRPNISNENVRPCVIPLGAAFKWDEDLGDGRFIADMCVRFCNGLGINPWHIPNHLRIQGIIRDLLPELTIMPPMPPDRRRAVAEMVITRNDTGKQEYREVSDNV